jgi:hypothetical protein
VSGRVLIDPGRETFCALSKVCDGGICTQVQIFESQTSLSVTLDRFTVGSILKQSKSWSF